MAAQSFPTPAESPAAWQPLLTGADASEARAAIDALSADLLTAQSYDEAWDTDPRQENAYDVFLASGAPGVALAFGSMAECDGDARALAASEALLETVAARLPELDLHPSLYVGIVGPAWVLAHLTRIGVARQFASDWTPALDDLDEQFAQYVAHRGWGSNYDLVKGLIGIGVYALERFPEPRAAQSLDAVLEHLADLAEESEDGVTWFTPPELIDPASMRRFRDGCYELGVAHGVAGAIAFLASAHAVAKDRVRIETLLDRAVRWLMGRREDGRFPYPREIARDGASEGGRLSWCNGNVGIAAALLKAGLVLDDAGVRSHAIELAVAGAGVEPREAHMIDPCLCHGTAGIAHVLNRMHQATGDARLEERAQTWYRAALRARGSGGIGGYLFGNPDGGDGVADPGFLMGAAGLLLALTAALGCEPQWDRALLVDMPSRQGAA